MKKEFNCGLKCGRCCVELPVVPLSLEEVKSGRYETMEVGNSKFWFKNEETEAEKAEFITRFIRNRRRSGQSDLLLKTEMKHIPELGMIKETCFYYDPHENICTTYGNRPGVCKRFNCGNKQEWTGDIAKHMREHEIN